jgi:hypothetical protein
MPGQGINLIKYFKKKILGIFCQKPKNAETAQEFHRFSSNKNVTDMDFHSGKDRTGDQSRHENPCRQI